MYNRENVISWKDCEKAHEYIGKKVYCGDSEEVIRDVIKEDIQDTLLSIKSGDAIATFYTTSGEFALILPVNKA